MPDYNAITSEEVELANLIAQAYAQGQKDLLVTLAEKKWGVKVAADLEAMLSPITSTGALLQVGTSFLHAATAERFLSTVRRSCGASKPSGRDARGSGARPLHGGLCRADAQATGQPNFCRAASRSLVRRNWPCRS